MVIKTTQNIASPSGAIVSGTSFRAKRERDGYRINSGEHSGLFVPNHSAFVIFDFALETDGRSRRGKAYD